MLIYSTPCHGSLTMLLSIDYIYIYIYSCIDSLLDVVTSIKNLKRKRKSRHSPSCIRGVFNFLDVQLTENNNTSSKTKNWWWWFWNDLPNFFCILDAFSSSFSAFDWIIENRWWLILAAANFSFSLLTAVSQGRTLATSLPYRREDWEKLFSGTSRSLGDGKDLNYFIMCIIHSS